jgi:transcriptional regulator of heat shock response
MRRGRLMADWTKIKTEYITTQISYRALEEKYGINYRVIADRGKKEGWSQLRSQHQDRTLTRAVEKICEKKADRAARLNDVAEKLLERVEQLLELDDKIVLDTQGMKHISGVLKDIKDIQMVRSEADLREQEARIAKLRREAEREEDDKDRKVTVTITGGDESWRK